MTMTMTMIAPGVDVGLNQTTKGTTIVRANAGRPTTMRTLRRPVVRVALRTITRTKDEAQRVVGRSEMKTTTTDRGGGGSSTTRTTRSTTNDKEGGAVKPRQAAW